ncbi:hypothetical protein LUZ60_008939 [Juncus effusus]|nr:hypothetical protein LUZ60_008939 [Juncus effusus]
MKTITSKLSKKLASSSMFMASPSSSQILTLTLYHLDHDHIISILLLLPHDSILSFSLTCKKLKSLAFSDSLWELVCKRDWGHKAIEAFMATLSDKEREGLRYRKLYQKICTVNSLSCKRLSCKGVAFPKPRASHSLNLVSDWLILFGGGCEGGRHLDDTWAVHIGNRANPLTWRHVNSGIPGGRFGHSCTQISDDSLILFGGINDSGVRLNDTWHGRVVWDSEIDVRIVWKLLEVGGYKPPARGAHSACCIENRAIVVHGGIGLYGLRLGDTWILDFSSQEESDQQELTGSTGLTASWRQEGTGARSASGPPARSGHSLTWIGGTFTVLFGGRGAGYEVLNDVWLFDFAGYPKWKELKHAQNQFDEMPSPRVGHSATLTLGKKILIYGGEDSGRHRKDDFWVLDVPTLLKYQSDTKTGTKNLWKRLSLEGESASFRSFHGAAVGVAGQFVYVFGGMVDGFLELGEALGLRFDGELYEIGLDLKL